MKKKLIIIFVVSLILLICALTACKDAEKLKINFVVDGEVAETVEFGGEGPINLPTPPQKEGYIFEGWFFDNGGAETLLSESAAREVLKSKQISVYAKWTPNKYTITFESNGGNAVAPVTQDFGSAIAAPEEPQKTGYTFAGWYTDNGTFQNLYEFKTMPLNGVTLYAKWTPNKYTITFESNGGNAVAPVTQDFGSTIAAPEEPQKSGYTFAGWYTDNGTFQNLYEFKTMPLNGVILYAKWEIQKFLVEFHGNGGNLASGQEAQTVEYGKAAVAPVYEKAGYTLSWDKPFDNITGALAVYAVWTPNKYTITFESNGGNEVSPITADYGAAIEAPLAPEREGYTFGGWYTDDGTFEDAFIFAVMPLDGAMLYAKWSVIKLDYYWQQNGGLLMEIWSDQLLPDFTQIMTGEDAARMYSNQGYADFESLLICYGIILAGQIESRSAANAVQYLIDNYSGAFNYSQYKDTGIIFIDIFSVSEILLGKTVCSEGAYFSSDGGTLIRYLGNAVSFTVPEGVKRIGEWAFALAVALETVNLPEGLTSIKQSAFSGCTKLTEIAIPDSVTEIEDGIFSGCVSLREITLGGGLTCISPFMFSNSGLSEITLTDNITEIGSSAFNGCGGLEEIIIPSSVTAVGDFAFEYCPALTIYAEAAEKPDGWKEKWNSGGRPVYWGYKPFFTVTFSGNGGALISGQEVQTVAFGKDAVAPVYQRDGYFFDGWDGDYTFVTADTFVTALWTSECSYTFYDYDGEVLLAKTAAYGDPITPPEVPPRASTPEKHYTFSGWSAAVPETITERALTFTAIYTETDRYYSYIFYDYDWTTIIKIASVTLSEPVEPDPPPQKPAVPGAEYTFLYWHYEPTGTPDEYCAYPMYMEYKFTYVYTFLNYDGTVLSQNEGYYGAKIYPPFVPYRKGDAQYSYTFIGWDKDIPEILTEDITFVACYSQTVNRYTVSFETYGGSEVESIVIEYGAKAARPADPVKNGEEFDGWYVESHFATLYDFDTVITKDITIYAKWNAFSFIDTAEGYILYRQNKVKGPQIVIPASYQDKPVIGIYSEAFKNSGLTSVSIPDTVESIGDHAFAYCKNLESVSLPASVTSIGAYAFYDSGLREITVSGVIGDNAFALCNNLTAVNLGEGVTSIGNSAFEQTAVQNILLPDALESIGNKAFKDCAYLISVGLPDGLLTIGEYAFENSIYLNDIAIPSGVTTIGKGAFKYTGINSASLPGGIGTVADELFMDTPLAEVTLGLGIEAVGEYAFYSTSLTRIDIPDSVKVIRYRAFGQCDSLKTLSLGKGVETLENYSVYVMLTKIISKAPVPPRISEYSYAGTPDIYVPAGSVDLYKAAEHWNLMLDWIYALPQITFETNGGTDIDLLVEEAGAPITAPNPPEKEGFTFDGWYTDNGTFEIPYSFSVMPSESLILYAKWV